MRTVSWKDAAYVQTAGPVRIRSYTVMVGEEHVARWKEDPDGRFGLIAPSEGRAPAQLEKFYPSL